MHPDPRLLRIAAGRTDLIMDIIEDLNSGPFPEADGAPLLHWATYYGDVSAVKALLGGGEQLPPLGKDLALHAAAFHGHWQLCEFLIESGASVKYTDPTTGETPLALTNATSGSRSPKEQLACRSRT